MLQSLFDCNSIHKLPRVLPAAERFTKRGKYLLLLTGDLDLTKSQTFSRLRLREITVVAHNDYFAPEGR